MVFFVVSFVPSVLFYFKRFFFPWCLAPILLMTTFAPYCCFCGRSLIIIRDLARLKKFLNFYYFSYYYHSFCVCGAGCAEKMRNNYLFLYTCKKDIYFFWWWFFCSSSKCVFVLKTLMVRFGSLGFFSERARSKRLWLLWWLIRFVFKKT